MTETKTCPRCGTTTRSQEGPGGLCAPCLMKMGFDSRSGAANVVFTEAERSERPPAPAIADLAAHFPDLEIRELVAQGGMGCVYRARQISLQRDVALKILTVGADDPSFGGRFEREARTLAGLSHPGIVSIFDFGQRGPWSFLVMEFVEGASLRQMMRARTLGSRESLAIVTQICDALQYAHDQGVVHRDIKPENVLVTREGRVKVLDFGLAKLVRGPQAANLTQTRQVMGTPHYMSPEQWEKPQTVDHRADIYSLGVVFYELLTGELPLGRFAPPSHMVAIDVRLDDVVLRSLEKEPGRRYQHASEVKTQVDGIVATPGGAPAPAKERKSRGHRVLWTVIGIACLLAVVPLGIAMLLVLGGRAQKQLDSRAGASVTSREQTGRVDMGPSPRAYVELGFVNLHMAPELGERLGLQPTAIDALNSRLAEVWQKYLRLESELVVCTWLPDGWLELQVRPATEQHQALLHEADDLVSKALGEDQNPARYEGELHAKLKRTLRFGAGPEHIALLIENGIARTRSQVPGERSTGSEPARDAYVRLWLRMMPTRPAQPK